MTRRYGTHSVPALEVRKCGKPELRGPSARITKRTIDKDRHAVWLLGVATSWGSGRAESRVD
jgi:hypothetical protein